jgi:CubicO group peptidase (beta-lactamase class C family)
LRNLLLLAFIAGLAYFTYISVTDSGGEGISLTPTQIGVADRAVADFMARYKVPALSLAWAKDGEIVLEKAYGAASIENNILATPRHLFRIASLSKPITSVMIMHLVEQGKLNLDDRIFGEGGILGQDYNTTDPNVRVLTVRHLLEHGAGSEWSNEANDPMFLNPLDTHEELIQWVLDTRRLSRAPGTSYHYSNFGYSVLGRVIEKVSDQDYDDYFQSMTSAAMLNSFTIAGNFNSGGNREVQYYSQEETSAYSIPVRRMDSHGGWSATATDMVKFLLLVDGFDSPPDILQPNSIRTMTSPNQHNANYAMGWAVNQYGNWWHMGSLPGTGSVAVRTSDNQAWAVFVNTRSLEANFEADLDGLMWRIVQGTGLR